jgi:hypothetical protein
MLRIWGLALTAGLFIASASPLGARAQAPPPLNAKAIYAETLKRVKDDPQARDGPRTTFAPANAPMPAAKAKLDQLLADEDDEGLLKVLQETSSFEEVSKDLNWERQQIYDGAGIVVSHAYIRDLWRVAEAEKGEAGASLKQSAVAFAVYAVAVTKVDGVRCADSAAAPYRAQQLLQDYPFIWTYGAGLKKPERDNIVAIGLVLEALTSPVRKNDNLLCLGARTGSMVEMIEGMAAMAKAGKAPQEVEKPGVIGKSYEITRAPPTFLPPEQWQSKQDALRTPLPDLFEHALDAKR